MRINELSIFSDALASVKRAAIYTAGDMHAVFHCCSDNQLIGRISPDGDPVEGWIAAAENFFINSDDIQMASEFILGYGKNDLSGLASYIEYYEKNVEKKLQTAESALQAKGKLYTVLGLFCSSVLVLLLI